jgi:hypothetical protein
MDLVVPADWVFQPLFLGKPQRFLNLRAHVGFADAAIEISHEHHGRNLLHQGTVPGFQIRKSTLRGDPFCSLAARRKNSRQALQNLFRHSGVHLHVRTGRRNAAGGTV